MGFVNYMLTGVFSEDSPLPPPLPNAWYTPEEITGVQGWSPLSLQGTTNRSWGIVVKLGTLTVESGFSGILNHHTIVQHDRVMNTTNSATGNIYFEMRAIDTAVDTITITPITETLQSYSYVWDVATGRDDIIAFATHQDNQPRTPTNNSQTYNLQDNFSIENATDSTIVVELYGAIYGDPGGYYSISDIVTITDNSEVIRG